MLPPLCVQNSQTCDGLICLTKQDSPHKWSHLLETLGLHRLPNRPSTHGDPPQWRCVGCMARPASPQTTFEVLLAPISYGVSRRAALPAKGCPAHAAHALVAQVGNPKTHMKSTDKHRPTATARNSSQLHSGGGKRRQDCERVSNKPQTGFQQTNKPMPKTTKYIYIKRGALINNLY